jgi:hypothetical protein
VQAMRRPGARRAPYILMIARERTIPQSALNVYRKRISIGKPCAARDPCTRVLQAQSPDRRNIFSHPQKNNFHDSLDRRPGIRFNRSSLVTQLQLESQRKGPADDSQRLNCE